MEVGDQIHTPAVLPPGKEPGIHWIWGCVGLRDGPDVLDTTKISMSLPGSSSTWLVCVKSTLYRVPKLHKYLFSFVNNIGHRIVNTNYCYYPFIQNTCIVFNSRQAREAKESTDSEQLRANLLTNIVFILPIKKKNIYCSANYVVPWAAWPPRIISLSNYYISHNLHLIFVRAICRRWK
jgi:hypothetical protein